MKMNKPRNKQHPIEIGGGFSTPQIQPISPFSDSADDCELYATPIAKVPAKSRVNKASKNRLKAKRIAEARLMQLSDELCKIADEIRYLSPLMAEMLDEAHDATEEAIDMMTDDRGW